MISQKKTARELFSARSQRTQVCIKQNRLIRHPRGGDVNDTDGTPLNSL